MEPGKMRLNEGLEQLKNMFPKLDKDVILSVLVVNKYEVEKTIEVLLGFESPDGAEPDSINAEKDREISLFGNIGQKNNNNK